MFIVVQALEKLEDLHDTAVMLVDSKCVISPVYLLGCYFLFSRIVSEEVEDNMKNVLSYFQWNILH